MKKTIANKLLRPGTKLHQAAIRTRRPGKRASSVVCRTNPYRCWCWRRAVTSTDIRAPASVKKCRTRITCKHCESMETDRDAQARVPAGKTRRAFTKSRPLSPPEVTYTISARSKSPDAPVFAFLRNHFGNVPLREIDSLFGFVARSTLYGGRAFTRRELSDRDVFQLNGAGIGVRLPLSNHYVERDEYEGNAALTQGTRIGGYGGLSAATVHRSRGSPLQVAKGPSRSHDRLLAWRPITRSIKQQRLA